MRGSFVGPTVAAWLMCAAPGDVTAQAPERVVLAELQRDTVELGEAFELSIDFDLPPNRTAYFPDTVPGTEHVESLGAVRWSVAPAPASGGSAGLSMVYPLIALRPGVVRLPDVTIITAPSADDGAAVGAWGARPPDAAAPSVQSHVVVGLDVWITSPLGVPTDDEPLLPRGPDDVVGRSWSRGVVLATLLFGGALAVVLGATGREWLRARAATHAPPPDDPREAARRAALAALDELRTLGLLEAGRVEEFYARTSASVRGYVEHIDPAWTPALTSTELMRGLERSGHRPGRAPELHREMGVAEIVKFGRLRPDARTADAHWSVLRAWVAGDGEAERSS